MLILSCKGCSIATSICRPPSHKIIRATRPAHVICTYNPKMNHIKKKKDSYLLKVSYSVGGRLDEFYLRDYKQQYTYHETEIVIGLLFAISTHLSSDTLLPSSVIRIVTHFLVL